MISRRFSTSTRVCPSSELTVTPYTLPPRCYAAHKDAVVPELARLAEDLDAAWEQPRHEAVAPATPTHRCETIVTEER